jgi:DNA polymerase-3 subunit gamma/tau
MTEETKPGAYRVLARKYRPQRFDALIGQEPLVRTLTHALAQKRIAHGYLLTGVRGVGKTTTARIIAKALNCIGPEGKSKDDGGPTATPCGVCEPCVSIAESRNIDVLEMDAASRTGIDDIREIIDSARYAAVAARYKVYIIDEVHMLSKAAFNGLLKTLEEPPPHVVFILATTEVRKVPVTVVSRCQRFDLRRVGAELLIDNLAAIAAKEGAKVERGALALIARAAEGSVRDAQSLLDQALSLGRAVSEADVHAMLGLIDRGRLFDLFEAVMAGRTADALASFAEQYESGADPLIVMQDLLGLVHWVTRLKLTPEAAADPTASETEVKRGQALAERLPVNVLTRAWSIVLKGLYDVQGAPESRAAAEMALIKLAFAADLPTPDEALKLLSESGAAPAQSAPGTGSRAEGVARATAPAAPVSAGSAALSLAPARAAAPAPAPAKPRIERFEDVVRLAAAHRDVALKTQLEDFVHLVRFEPPRMEFRPAEGAPADLAGRLQAALNAWTGERWSLSVVRAEGAPTLSQERLRRERALRADVARDPLVAAALKIFPGAEITQIRELGLQAPPAPEDEGFIPDEDEEDA